MARVHPHREPPLVFVLTIFRWHEAKCLNLFPVDTKPIKVEGPSGPFTIRQGVIFNPGALLLGLDLAKELDRMAAEERIARNPALRQS